MSARDPAPKVPAERAGTGMQCEVCGVSMMDAPLYRNGPKGQRVPWRCIVHVDPEWKPDAQVQSVAEIISGGRP